MSSKIAVGCVWKLKKAQNSGVFIYFWAFTCPADVKLAGHFFGITFSWLNLKLKNWQWLRSKAQKRLKIKVRFLFFWARSCPANFTELLSAKTARIGNPYRTEYCGLPESKCAEASDTSCTDLHNLLRDQNCKAFLGKRIRNSRWRIFVKSTLIGFFFVIIIYKFG